MLFAALLLAFGCVAPARASVAVLLEQPYGGLGVFNPTGHSALYFDHICAATPLELRPCQPGELGVVISRYNGISTVDWVAVPLVPYLYAVSSPAQIPSRVDRLSALRLRDLYRREHLQSVAPNTEEGGLPPGNWYELVGSAFDRTIYGFQVDTTPAQDAEIIALFNDRPNVTHYSGAFRNCADFARVVMNRLYPHAIRRNFVADFGLTTPKNVAHSLTRYAKKHPETDFQVFQIPQVAGDLPRSVGVEGVTESLLKRYGVPLAVLSPHVTAVVLIAYVGRGRFSVPHDAPVLDVAALQATRTQEALLEARAGGRPEAAAHPGADSQLASAGANPASAEAGRYSGDAAGQGLLAMPGMAPRMAPASFANSFGLEEGACAECNTLAPLP